MEKYKDKYINQLTETVCNIMKKCSSEGKISESEFNLLLFYKSELKRIEKLEIPEKIMSYLKTLKNFLSEENIEEEEYNDEL